MKKKIAVLLMFVVSSLSILTGCNLFSTNNYNSLSAIVATSGENIQITREQLLNAFQSNGVYYVQYYGLSQEDALKQTIVDLVDQEYLLNYLDSEEGKVYALDAYDYKQVVEETWKFIDSSLDPFIEQVRKDFGLPKEELQAKEEEKKPEFAPQKQYETKFEKGLDGKIYIVSENRMIASEDEINFPDEETALKFAKEKFNYKNHIKSDNEDYKTIIWADYMTAVKRSQKHYNHKDMSDKACFEREIERGFKANLKNRKITKFEEIVKASNGFIFDADKIGSNKYYMNDSYKLKIVDYYKQKFVENYDRYQANKSIYLKGLATSTKRDDIYYYGESDLETLITCSHILIKLSEDQINEIKAVKEDVTLNDMMKEQKIEEIKSRTLAFERDRETGEVIDKNGITVTELFNELNRTIKTKATLEEKTKVFNDFLYRYNVDSGIINAKYDYVVGTKNSTMVESFTNTVRDLYNKDMSGEGYVGDLASPIYEENSNYSGYHIVFYTGHLQNMFESKESLDGLTIENVFDVLNSEKTSLSYNQTIFEDIYDKIAKDNYNKVRFDLISSLKSGKDIQFNNGNFKDLY